MFLLSFISGKKKKNIVSHANEQTKFFVNSRVLFVTPQQ